MNGKKKGAQRLMNKKKMGKLLKECRIVSQMTMQDLVNALDEEFLTVTIKTIADWESGKTIPELDRLQFLSKLYHLTIDEILDGERALTNADLQKDYPLISGELQKIKDHIEYFNKRTQQVKKINKRFKELLIKYYVSGLSLNERQELHYLFNGKCSLSDYFDYDRSSSDDFVDFYNMLWLLKKDSRFSNEQEFYWEVQKYFDSKGMPYSLTFYAISDEELFNGNDFVQYLVKQAEPWELDAVVSGFQKFEPISYQIDASSNGLDRYKEKHNKEFNREEIYKNTLKYLLTHGAMLNPCFFSYRLIKNKKVQIIDRLEELYRLCVRPLEVFIAENDEVGKAKRCFVQNTRFNRFLDKYYELKNATGCGIHSDKLSPQKLYSLLFEDDDNERIVKFLCESRNIDTNRDKSRILADLSFELNYWKKEKQKVLEKEKQIEAGLKEIKKLEALLEKGETFYSVEYIEEVGPSESRNVISFASKCKRELTYSAFNKERDKKSTESLLNEIDNLSIDQIRKKYFPIYEYKVGGQTNGK